MRKLAPIAAGLALGAVLIYAAIYTLVKTGGESQFSPETFEHRGVKLHHFPFTDVLIRVKPSNPYRKRIVMFWIDEGYLRDLPKHARCWDTVTGWRSGQRWSYGGPAKAFWYRCGCQSDDGEKDWIAWSKRNPQLASKLWPKVIDFLKSATDGRNSYVNYHLAAVLMMYVQDTQDQESYDAAYLKWHEYYQAVRAEVGI